MSYELLPFTMTGTTKTYNDGKAMPWGITTSGSYGEIYCDSLNSTTGANMKITM